MDARRAPICDPSPAAASLRQKTNLELQSMGALYPRWLVGDRMGRYGEI